MKVGVWGSRAVVAAAVVLATFTSSAARGVGVSGDGLVLSIANGGDAGRYRAPSGDRCVVNRVAGSESLVYYSADAEAQPPGGFVLFYVLGYRGPGTYRAGLTASALYGKRSATWLTWAVNRWDRYAGEVDVVVDRDRGGAISGSLSATLRHFFSSKPARSSGAWNCATAERTMPVVASAPSSTVAGSVNGVAFRLPASWHVDAGCPFPATADQLVADVSPQPLFEQALRFPDGETCLYPIDVLLPGSVLIRWNGGFLPGTSTQPPPGATNITSSAGPGWFQVDPNGCIDLLGEEEIVIVVPLPQLQISACIRGPDVALLQSEAMDVMLSTTLARP